MKYTYDPSSRRVLCDGIPMRDGKEIARRLNEAETIKAQCEVHVTGDVDVTTPLEPGRVVRDESRVLTAAATDVLAERQRQITAEGWTPEHDDRHVEGELAEAAAVYAMWAVPKPKSTPAANWPFERYWFKPKTKRQDLVRAAALLLAEIERLDRMNNDDVKEDR